MLSWVQRLALEYLTLQSGAHPSLQTVLVVSSFNTQQLAQMRKYFFCLRKRKPAQTGAKLLHQLTAQPRCPWTLMAGTGLTSQILNYQPYVELGQIRSMLKAAALGGHLETLQALMETFYGQSLQPALEYTLRGGHLTNLEWLLLQPGVVPTATAFSLAVKSGQLEALRLLLSRAEPPSRALHDACLAGQLEMIKLLLEAGLAVESHNVWGAVMSAQVEVVKFLYSICGRSCLKPEYLRLAAEQRSVGLVEFLFEHGPRQHYRLNDVLVRSAAVPRQDPAVTELLLRLGATQVEQALAAAAEAGNTDLVEFLLSRGAAKINQALVLAAGKARLETVRALLNRGASALNKALVTAVRCHCPQMLELLLEAGATDILAAVEAALDHRVSWVVQYLLPRLPVVTLEPACVGRLLEVAAPRASIDILTELLNWCRAVPGVMSKALMAVLDTHNIFSEARLRLLLDRGAGPKEHALEVAVAAGNLQAVRILLAYGAPVTAAARLLAESRSDNMRRLLEGIYPIGDGK